jgi:hypothetical protein
MTSTRRYVRIYIEAFIEDSGMSTCMYVLNSESTSIGFCSSETSDGTWPFPMCSGTRRGDLGVSGETINFARRRCRTSNAPAARLRRYSTDLDLRGHPLPMKISFFQVPSFFEFSGRTATPESRSLGLCPPRRRCGARAAVVGKIRTLKTF